MPLFAVPLFSTTNLYQDQDIIWTILGYVGIFFVYTWWLWAFIILFICARSAFLFLQNRKYEHAWKWAHLEMRIPREILKSPRSMDQLFQAIAALRNVEGDFGEKYIDGEITKWFALEMVSFGGEIHFYIRCMKGYRRMVEAAFFAYYPDVEIEEVPDYTHTLPHNIADMQATNLDLWGTEMVLQRDFGYPLRTYLEYENYEEMHQLDPMSVFMENMAKAKKGEFVGVQYVVEPLSRTWGEAYENLVEDLREPKFSEKVGHEAPATGGVSSTAFRAALIQRTPGIVDVLTAVEANLAKPAFNTIVRFIYIAPLTIFYEQYARRSIAGSFNQYGAMDLNYFFYDEGIATKINPGTWPFWFRLKRFDARKQRVLQNYINREMQIHTFWGKLLSSNIFDWNFKSRPQVLNTESMATLFHPPSNLVLTAPHTQRVESKKVGAPAGLPIYGDEKIIEQFK